jgi:Zn-dependent M16 (insulinase) family peptidase
LFDILRELLFHIEFSDITRLKKLLLEYRAGLESMVIPSGHRLAMMISARNFSISSALDEIWHGIHQLKLIKNITDDPKEDKVESISTTLTAIGNAILKNSNFKPAVIGEKSALSEALSPVTDIRKGLESGITDGFRQPDISVEDKLPREGWTTAAAVSYVVRTFRTVPMEHDDSPALMVISKLLRSLYLHREIREKGGAYGGFALYSLENGLFYLASYRDPHIVSTLNVYDSAMHFIRSGKFTKEDITEAILQVCSDIDKPDPPGPAARKAFYRKIISLDDADRIRFKQKILALNHSQVKRVADKYFSPDRSDYAVAVISDEEKLKAANARLGENALSLHEI